MKHITENLTTPIYGEYDVIVVGAGPAGIAAAITAGRLGARVLIIESCGRVGGISTAGMMSHFTGTVGNAKCGDIMRIFLDIDENQVIRDVKFKTFGCGAAIATSSMATELVKGKTIYEALEVTNKAVMNALDGLPAVKVHCSLLAEEAIHAALWDYTQKSGIVIEGLEPPVEDIGEHEEIEEED